MPRVASSPEAPTPSRKSWSSPPSGSTTCRFPAASAAARGDRKALAEVSACGFMQRVEAMGQGSRGSRDMLQQGWSCPRRIDPRLSADATPCQLCPSRSRCGLLGLLGDVRGKSQTRIQVGAFRPGAPILTQPSHLCAVRSGAVKSVWNDAGRLSACANQPIGKRIFHPVSTDSACVHRRGRCLHPVVDRGGVVDRLVRIVRAHRVGAHNRWSQRCGGIPGRWPSWACA